MPLPRQILISELLRSRLRDELGQDLGVGHQVWMHPPCHRLLGWSSRPSAFGPRRSVWRLDQLVDWLEGQVEVEGEPADTEQPTLDLLPTLMEATLLGQQQQPLGRLVDAVVDVQSGRINHYLVARSDPRLPGSSRWRLTPDRILDQRPGVVSTGLITLEDLPLHRASLRQDLLQRTQRWRDQLRQMGDRAGDRLEGWLDEPPWQEDDGSPPSVSSRSRLDDADPLEDWEDELWTEPQPSRPKDRDEDPWV